MDDSKYRNFFENSADAMLIIEEGEFVDCNSATLSMLGYDTKEELINTPPFKLSPEFQPDGSLSFDKAEEMMQLAREQGNHQFEWDHLRKDGSVIPVEVSLTAIETSQGSSLHTVWRDISERKLAEKAIRDSEHRFHTIFETIPDVVAITRISDDIVIDINQAYESLTGFKRELLIGRSSTELGSWVNIADRERMIELVSKNGFVRNMQAPMRSSDNLVREALISAKTIILHDEPHLLTIFKDISDRARAETALKESEERFRQIFETNPDPVILAKLGDGAIIDVNKAFEALSGISRLDALGHNSLQLGLWADEKMREPFLAQLRSDGQLNNFEADFRVMGDQLRTGLLSARIININSEPSILIVIRDITTEKAAERTMIEMDRMKSEFISTAAHELSTPLSAMMGYTEFLINPDYFGGFSEEQKQNFRYEIYDRGEALNRIIEDLLDISRIESGHPIRLDLQKTELDDILRKSIDFFRANDTGHKFRLEIPEQPPNKTLLIDRHRVTQVLENLLSNAVKYSPKDKEIVLKGQEARDGWEIRIEDQGIGMNLEQLDRIFDKFYRADASNTAIGGLGLGMSIARQIVEAHGGNIQVESTEGEGTTVTFYLPNAIT